MSRAGDGGFQGAVGGRRMIALAPLIRSAPPLQ